MKVIQATFFTCLLLLPIPTQAVQLISIPKNSPVENKFIAQAFLDDRCPEQYVHLRGSTSNRTVTICGERDTGIPTHYIADTKKNGGSIFLPLSSYTKTQFVARNGRYIYILDIKKSNLTIKVSRQRPRVEKFTIDLP
ncbi:MAG: hypothetical protein V7L01_12290 [Nostoc sp.]|uniref:hypothetical protein n=1 Tax=Nostoc sp. TaxID=1180 RepID=UPI002FFAA24A